MKKSIFFTGIITSAIIGNISCKNMELKKMDMAQVHQLEDSIPTLIAGVSTIHTIQEENDYTSVKIIIGDVPFYSSTPEAKQEAANRVGVTLLHILGPDNSISKATLTVTKNIKDNLDNPPDAINTEINMESLKKTVFPGK